MWGPRPLCPPTTRPISDAIYPSVEAIPVSPPRQLDLPGLRGRFLGARLVLRRKHYAYRTETSMQRKIEEALLAVILTNRLSKDEILELYLNEIYYGNLAYGIEAASQVILGKSATELTLGEAALLAGLRASQILAGVCAALAAWGLGEAARDYGGDATGRI